MLHPIAISETTKSTYTSNPYLVNKQLKITNISNEFINNIKLYITSDTLNICEEAIIRQRGSLSFDPDTKCFELGNLAPNESAYFEYKFISPSSLSSLSHYFSITYHEDQATLSVTQSLTDYLTPIQPDKNL